MNADTAPPLTGRVVLALMLFCLLFAALAVGYRTYSAANNPGLSLRQDELVFHAAEIQRLAGGGALVAADSRTAMIPGYHALLAAVPTPLRVPLHVGGNVLGLLLLLLLVRTLLPGNPAATAAVWLAMVVAPYSLGQAAWISTDGLSRGLFAATLVAAARLRPGWRGDALLMALAVATVLVRSIYLPALGLLLLLALTWPALAIERRRALLTLAAMLTAVAPFLLEWRGLTSPGLDAREEPGLTRTVVLAELFWAGLLLPLLWFACERRSLAPLLPGLPVAAAAIGWTLVYGTWALVAENTPEALRSGAMLYMLDHARLPMALLMAVKLAGVGLGAGFVAALAWQAWRQPPREPVILTGLIAYLMSLWLQPRPYNRYFELFLLLALLVPMRRELSHSAWRYTPLVLFFAAYAAALHLFQR